MEILVVLGMFAILVVVIINIFILSLRAQRETALRQETLSNIRFVTETIARQVRISEIDYAFAYDGDGDSAIQGSEQELYLTDQQGNAFAYFLDNATGEIKVSLNGQVSSLTNSNDVTVVKLLFYIDPTGDPFLDERCNDSHTPTGCLLGANICTVDDDNNEFKTGFCSCNGPEDCATGHCDVADNVCLPFDEQPRVTMVVSFESVGIRPEDRKRVNMQTTVSSRVYKR